MGGLKREPAPSLKNKLSRGIWAVVYVSLLRWTPVPLHGWRCAWLRLFGAKIGKHCAIYPTAKIWAPWNCNIGDASTVGPGAILYSVGKVHIESRVVISQGAHICTASHDHNSPSFDLLTGAIRIADDAWVAAEAFVGPGVEIGAGAVVAARAVVTRAVSSRAIVAGNPAKVIGTRDTAGQNVLRGRVEAARKSAVS